jgi:methylenetetrahydrofolate reductase (NADPH)
MVRRRIGAGAETPAGRVMTGTDDLRISFEFFPPKTPEMEDQLWLAIRHLEGLQPTFVSVTYGAAGTTRERTHATVKRILEETKLVPAAHLTCIGATRDEIDDIVRDYWQAGVRHLVALRGDPPEGIDAPYHPTPGGYENSAALTRGIRAVGDFEISVACNPEKHPHSPSLEADLDLLKRKIDAGATRAITQFFFDPDVYFRFVERARRSGITIPIVPGIMPIVSEKGVRRMAEKIPTTLPAKLLATIDGLDQEPTIRPLVSAYLAADLCERLRAGGVRDFHFFTLNRAELTSAICRLLGRRRII